MAKEKSFGQRIRELRLARKLSQRDLADAVAKRLKDDDRRGFDVSYLSKIENDRMRPPSTAAILALAEELKANSDELLALAGRAPADVGEALKQSPAARAFFRSAVDGKLSEADWKKLLKSLQRKKQ
jgi:transcriptional regulator with XRE-family HTH domain